MQTVKTLKVKLGDKYRVPLTKTHIIGVEVTKLGTHEIEFKVSGEGVENPDDSRVMGIIAFVKWFTSYPYKRVDRWQL